MSTCCLTSTQYLTFRLSLRQSSASSSRQLPCFLNEKGILGVYQSAYRPRHSAGTALLRIHSDVAQAIDARRGVLLVLLDLTAAFDTILHDILLRRLYGYGIRGKVHAWLASYLYGRTSAVPVRKVFECP